MRAGRGRAIEERPENYGGTPFDVELPPKICLAGAERRHSFARGDVPVAAAKIELTSPLPPLPFFSPQTSHHIPTIATSLNQNVELAWQATDLQRGAGFHYAEEKKKGKWENRVRQKLLTCLTPTNSERH